MLSQKLQDAINAQINKELYSEFFYFAMAAYFESEGLKGFANFFKVQVEEERFHSMKFFNYMNERGAKVIMDAIAAPPQEFKSALDVFEQAYKHEQFVTKSINDLMALAMAENDFATISFLNWYVDEQVEEEATMDDIVNQLKFIGDNGYGLLMLDKELGSRSFTPPAK